MEDYQKAIRQATQLTTTQLEIVAREGYDEKVKAGVLKPFESVFTNIAAGKLALKDLEVIMRQYKFTTDELAVVRTSYPDSLVRSIYYVIKVLRKNCLKNEQILAIIVPMTVTDLKNLIIQQIYKVDNYRTVLSRADNLSLFDDLNS